MAYATAINISPKGNMTLPQEFMDALGSSVVTAEIDKNHNIILYPLRDVKGVFREYAKEIDPPFEEVRHIALTKALARYKPKK